MQILFFTYMQNNVASMSYKLWKTFNLCSSMLWFQYALVHLQRGFGFLFAFILKFHPVI